jgi:hypothetical protein
MRPARFDTQVKRIGLHFEEGASIRTVVFAHFDGELRTGLRKARVE